jgi:hypothetical protein
MQVSREDLESAMVHLRSIRNDWERLSRVVTNDPTFRDAFAKLNNLVTRWQAKLDDNEQSSAIDSNPWPLSIEYLGHEYFWACRVDLINGEWQGEYQRVELGVVYAVRFPKSACLRLRV